MSFQEASYKRHAEKFQDDLADESRIARNRTWFDKDTANHWRHARMYAVVDSFRSELESSWLTVGDGRYGSDAIEIAEKGFANVLATDISETLLKEAQKEGRIQRYAVENAESLSFAQNEFDYVFCKESYHHFPRPSIALYEMLRVAKKAVVLVEPNDPDRIPFRRFKHLMKTALKGRSHIDASFYEESGNYVYSISRRELEKVALGTNLPMIATKGLNDCYIEGCEFEPASWKSAIYRRIRTKCALKDIAARTFLYDYTLLMAILFKEPPSESIVAQLRMARWNLHPLPRNPYA